MNTTINSEAQEAVHLEKLRAQISTDIETMHEKEASLREYEQRLRLLVEQARHSNPPQPANPYFATATPNAAGLDAEWEKYKRAHALLEAARRGLCDDRLAIKEREERVQLREQDVARREAWVKTREQELAVQAQAQTQIQAEAQAKAEELANKPSFTAAPFLAARNLLMSRRN